MRHQAERLGVIARAYRTETLDPFLARACEVTGMDIALPMNTGAEAVETALKAARKWAYAIKRVPADRAEIMVCADNFHGRTIAITGLSTVPQYREGFGPFPAGTVVVPFGDLAALEAAITPHTAAFLVEPIQGEAGIIVPPDGYLAGAAVICRRHRVLLICDEVQTGLGRTGRVLASDHDGVRPDGLTLGKALGGGLVPVSLFLASEEVMGVFRPGDHGSTFGGYPIAAAVGLEALNMLVDERLSERSARLGERLLRGLAHLHHPLIREVRGRGLFVGLEIDAAVVSARTVVDALLARGVLTKDTHRNSIRLAPPLVISEAEIDWAVATIRDALDEIGGDLRRLAA
jgi:ornithine--oxo-acid transaminase